MSLGIFNRKTRRSVAAWRPIGFYSKASIGLSKAQKRKLSKERHYGPFGALKDGHFQLDYNFDELVRIQEANGFLYDWNTGVNNQTIRLNIKPVLCLAIGDERKEMRKERILKMKQA